MRQALGGDAELGEETLPAFQFSLEATGVLIENGAPLHP
jgi:hypothetical protein